jgi:hypothetical protein
MCLSCILEAASSNLGYVDWVSSGFTQSFEEYGGIVPSKYIMAASFHFHFAVNSHLRRLYITYAVVSYIYVGGWTILGWDGMDCHVRWVPCHHGMARPQVTDGGDALQLWREAENILNKQSRTAKGWSSSLGVGRGANNSSP